LLLGKINLLVRFERTAEVQSGSCSQIVALLTLQRVNQREAGHLTGCQMTLARSIALLQYLNHLKRLFFIHSNRVLKLYK
ncbi:hypothetical protein, partial [Escherichia coli]|uniref:hypothetical protein n=1 Tax=Escherichia coli TaxID=562 RepID=UPI001B8B7C93